MAEPMEEVNEILRHRTAVVLGQLAKKIATMEKQTGPVNMVASKVARREVAQ